MLTAIGFATRGEHTVAPHIGLEVDEVVAMNERGVANEAAVAVPVVVSPKREKADPRIVELLAMTKASPVSRPAATASVSTSLAHVLPAAMKPAVAQQPAFVQQAAPVQQVVVDMRADSVVAKYVAVGKALKAAKSDELWARFRLIRINEAIATADGRRNTLVALAAIEQQIAQ